MGGANPVISDEIRVGPPASIPVGGVGSKPNPPVIVNVPNGGKVAVAPDAGEIVYMIVDAVAGIDDARNAGAETTIAPRRLR
jgi:hypothetical protein